MKRRLCWKIAKNLAWPLSWSFWRIVLIDRDYPAWALYSMMWKVALLDILQMLLVPDHLNEAAP